MDGMIRKQTSDLQADRNIQTYRFKYKRMINWVNTRTNGQFICMHVSAVHSRAHAYTLENEHRSKKLGVRNKDYHGNAYMHQTKKLIQPGAPTTRRWMDGQSDGPKNEKKTYKPTE